MVVLNGAEGVEDMLAKVITVGGTGLGLARSLLGNDRLAKDGLGTDRLAKDGLGTDGLGTDGSRPAAAVPAAEPPTLPEETDAEE